MSKSRISLTRQVAEIRRTFRALPDQIMKPAVTSAINKVAALARTQAVREMKQIYALPASALRRAIFVNRATRTTLTATLKAEGSPLPLILFKARQTKKGVTYEIKRGRRVLFPHAFIATMSSGHRGVFARGKYASNQFIGRHKRLKRYPLSDTPITQIVGVGVVTSFGQAEVQAVLEATVREKFPDILRNQIEFRLGKLSG